MNHTPATKSANRASAEPRLSAVCWAVGMWVYGIVVGLAFFGKTLHQANSEGAAAAIGVWAACTIYYWVSRRNDGVWLIGMGMPVVIQPDHRLGFWSILFIVLVYGVPLAGLSGYLLKRFDSKAERSVTRCSDAMYDPEVDGLKEAR